MVIDKQEVGNHFRKSMQSYDENARVQKIVIDRLCPLILSSLQRIPRNVLEIGCGTGLLTSRLKEIFTNKLFYINDLVEDLCYKAASANGIPMKYCVPGDIEQIQLPIEFDLLISASTFQWFTNPASTFQKLSEGLREGGAMLFTTFGKYNLREIRLTTGGGLTYKTKEELTELLLPYFDVEEVIEEYHLIEFDNPLDVLQHLKRTGVNVSGDRSIWTRGRVNAFIDDYNARFAMDGKVTLTYHPLYFICRKKRLKTVESDNDEHIELDDWSHSSCEAEI